VTSSSGSSSPCCTTSRSGRARLSTPLLIALACAALALGCACGCARTVLVSESSPVRVGPCVRGRVYALVQGEWRLGSSVTLPEGWYLVPPSFVEEEE
jgi:hypothetical protein